MKSNPVDILIMFVAILASMLLILGVMAIICSPVVMVLSWWMKGLITSHQLGVFLICAFTSLFLLYILEATSNEGETE